MENGINCWTRIWIFVIVRLGESKLMYQNQVSIILRERLHFVVFICINNDIRK